MRGNAAKINALFLREYLRQKTSVPKAKGKETFEGGFETVIDLASLPVGTRLRIGDAVLEISQIGKECHTGCAIREKTGECVMPKRGVFARVLKGGEITDEDTGSYDI